MWRIEEAGPSEKAFYVAMDDGLISWQGFAKINISFRLRLYVRLRLIDFPALENPQ